MGTGWLNGAEFTELLDTSDPEYVPAEDDFPYMPLREAEYRRKMQEENSRGTKTTRSSSAGRSERPWPSRSGTT